jgi:hypothetical protein
MLLVFILAKFLKIENGCYEKTTFGVTKEDFTLCAYDFFAYHYLTDFDGVIGLDFFDDLNFCINLKLGIITIEKV